MKAMKNPILKDNAGFTLVEVMVAIVVLAIGIIGAGAMQLSVLNDNASSFDRTEATALALDQVEKISSWAYDNASLADDDDTPYQRIGVDPDTMRITTVPSVGDSSTVNGSYTIYLDISDDFPAIDSKTIRVDVVWSEGPNLRTVSLNYVKTRY